MIGELGEYQNDQLTLVKPRTGLITERTINETTRKEILCVLEWNISF